MGYKKGEIPPYHKLELRSPFKRKPLIQNARDAELWSEAKEDSPPPKAPEKPLTRNPSHLMSVPDSLLVSASQFTDGSPASQEFTLTRTESKMQDEDSPPTQPQDESPKTEPLVSKEADLN